MSLPPELWDVLTLSFMNLGSILAGFFVGRRADQPQKIVVGAFASGVAGVVFAMLIMALGWSEVRTGSLAGVFVLCFLFGVAWTWIGYISRKPRPEP